MATLREEARKNRIFVSKDLEINSWEAIQPYYKSLQDTEISTTDQLKLWLQKRSELIQVVEEEKAWRYINTSRETDNKDFAEAFVIFSQEIEPEIIKAEKELDTKLVESEKSIDLPTKYQIAIRGVKNQLKIYREENVSIQAELEVAEQKYSAITGKMSIYFKGQDLTLQQADNLLKSTQRKTRKEVYDLIQSRRGVDSDELNTLFDSLIRKRTCIAQNANFDNYLHYRFNQLNRFDYAISDCENFHESVKQSVVPIIDDLYEKRKTSLAVEHLFPYDLQVDPEENDPVKPAKNTTELLEKSITCLNDVDPEFGACLNTLKINDYLDLESRKGKAPGGYNYPLFESNVPFIFMNASNSLRDLTTLMHESGHAIHSILSGEQPLVYFKDFPAEIAELASMSMELISMEHWNTIFENEDELKRAKKEQIEGILHVLPWIASIDKFQHWIYSNPNRTATDRINAWNKIRNEYEGAGIDWWGYEQHRKNQWQKQIHLFQFPLYYIEYGIAQLGAIGVWMNYKKNPQKAIEQYKEALKLGYTKTLPELYEAAGVSFDFSLKHIKKLMGFVKDELDKLS